MSDKPTTAEQWDQAGIRQPFEDTKPSPPKAEQPKADDPRVNEYVCSCCERTIVTVDREAGTTPFLVACKTFGGNCPGQTTSRFYKVDQDATRATWEWFKPKTAGERKKIGTDKALQEHVRLGGLLLRERRVVTKSTETRCPKCGAWVEDLDGFGVLAHLAPHPTACGYCSHPSRDGGVCGICGDLEAKRQS